MELVCSLATVGSLPVLQVRGEVDLATLPYLRDQLTRAVQLHQGGTIVVDLDGVTALDDTGLGMLLGAAGRARETGGEMVLVCTNSRLRQRFALTGLDRAIEMRARISPTQTPE